MEPKKIVTTPMCSEVLRMAGLKDYMISSQPFNETSDWIIVLSETKIDYPPKTKVIKLKLNTFTQIERSIKLIADIFNITPSSIYGEYDYSPVNDHNRKIKVKVYANFIKDIVKDMGYSLVDHDPDFIVYPDYLKEELSDEITEMRERAIEIPSHKHAPINPLKRAEERYQILEKNLCMKP